MLYDIAFFNISIFLLWLPYYKHFYQLLGILQRSVTFLSDYITNAATLFPNFF